MPSVPTSPLLAPPDASVRRHGFIDDAQALLAGALLISLGVSLLGQAKLITGGAVGLAFLVHYATGIDFGSAFFLINLPFYVLAVRKMGWGFTLKTFCAVFLVAVASGMMPRLLGVARIDPFYAAVMGGLLMGVGLLVLFRHKSSLGGLSILVLHLQERRGWPAGWVQLGLDALILLASVPMISVGAVGISLIGAAVLNLSLAINHRPGRYIAA